jgi:prolyl aminopeptidase (EC:3.4.11.5). Serine peptidase. MEROPS family S33
MLEAYWRRLTSDNEATRLAAAQAWSAWEGGSTTLQHDAHGGGDFDDPHRALSLALMEAHYFRHRIFLEENQLLRDIDRIRHIPSTIVHGRYDIICPVKNAWDLSQAWPESRTARGAGRPQRGRSGNRRRAGHRHRCIGRALALRPVRY